MAGVGDEALSFDWSVNASAPVDASETFIEHTVFAWQLDLSAGPLVQQPYKAGAHL